MVRTPPFQGENPGSNPSGAARNQKYHRSVVFLISFGAPLGLRASAIGTQHENADEQLANPQKRICLIEFLHLGLIIVCQGSGGAAKIKRPPFGGLFIFSIFLMSDIFFDNIHAFDHQSCLPDMRTEPSFRCILP